jgi:hypothetical protein
MGHVTSPDQGLSSKRGKSLGTRLVLSKIVALRDGSTYMKIKTKKKQSWTKPLRSFQPILATKLLNIDKTNFVPSSALRPPPPTMQFNVVNNAETTFGNTP